MEGPIKGDIIVIEFPFSNLEEAKRRPVFVLKVPKGDDVIVNQITGFSNQKEVEISIKSLDFKQGSLKRDSFLRIDKIGSVERSLIKYRIGSLKKEKTDKIIESVCSFLKN